MDRSDPGSIGSLGLLRRRLADPELRNYSSFVGLFQYPVSSFFFPFRLSRRLFVDPLLEGAKAYTFGLLTGGSSLNSYVPGQSLFGGTAIVSASFLVAYIPADPHVSYVYEVFPLSQCQMGRHPQPAGRRIEAAIMENLELKPTWGAKHMEADGQKSWRDIASSTPKEMK